MTEILTATSVIVPIVVAITQLLKKQVPNTKWLPVINVALGVLIGFLYAISFVPADQVLYLWGGALAGLSASGFYDIGKKVIGGNENVSDQ